MVCSRLEQKNHQSITVLEFVKVDSPSPSLDCQITLIINTVCKPQGCIDPSVFLSLAACTQGLQYSVCVCVCPLSTKHCEGLYYNLKILALILQGFNLQISLKPFLSKVRIFFVHLWLVGLAVRVLTAHAHALISDVHQSGLTLVYNIIIFQRYELFCFSFEKKPSMQMAFAIDRA